MYYRFEMSEQNLLTIQIIFTDPTGVHISQFKNPSS